MLRSSSLMLAGIACAGSYGRYYLFKYYGPQPLGLNRVGHIYEWRGRKVKTIGYTGHSDLTIKNIDYNRFLWFTDEAGTAVRYAIRNGMSSGRKGQVAEVVIDAEKKLETKHFDLTFFFMSSKHVPITPLAMKELDLTVREDNAVTVDSSLHKHGLLADLKRLAERWLSSNAKSSF